jgi:hypothetical protein
VDPNETAYSSARQPKRHLTFDGHLLRQFKKYRGLADKSDETIEKDHQVLTQSRDRFRGISSYEMRETCIRRELRRSRSHEIQRSIDRYDTMIKHDAGAKRACDTVERYPTNPTNRYPRPLVRSPAYFPNQQCFAKFEAFSAGLRCQGCPGF